MIKYEMKKEKKVDKRILKWLSVITIAYLMYYLLWRGTNTINPNAVFFSWLLLGAEVFGVLNYLLFSWTTFDISPTREFKKPPNDLKVDIFVPTYNEDLEILEATLIGCNNIRYPHITYLLDDGNRPEVEMLARQLNVEYIARKDNEHAKAGNINNALKYSDGEFIVILDCDMVPQPDFLDRSLGYFEDMDLAFIQMPQEFYNNDSIQHDPKKNYWHEQTLFYRVIQPGKNKNNAAFWCGSPSIVRRKALESVGGIATETITEDIHTSVRLHSKGWKSYFLNELLAFGIAPQTVKTFLLQRLRWAQGTMQLYRSPDSPLTTPGLSLAQRLSYVSSFLAYFEAFQKIILILTPAIIILFKIYPINVGLFDFLLHWLPYFGLTIVANVVFGRGYFRYFQVEKYNLLKMVTFIQSTITLVYRKPLKFLVSPKSVNSSVYRDERRALRLYFVLFGLIAGAVIYGIVGVFLSQSFQQSLPTYVAAVFWASYNALLILLGIIEVLKKKHERKYYRFPVTGCAELICTKNENYLFDIELENVSLLGAGFISHSGLVDEEGKYNLRLISDNGIDIHLPIKKIHFQRELENGDYQLGVSFAEMNAVQKSNFNFFLFILLPRMLVEKHKIEDNRSDGFEFLSNFYLFKDKSFHPSSSSR